MTYGSLEILHQRGRFLISGVGLIGAGLYHLAAALYSVYSSSCGTSTISAERKITVQRRLRPSHFVAVQIRNPEIRSKIIEFQRHVRDQKRVYERTFISVSSLHITLMVFAIDEENDWMKNEVIKVVGAIAEELKTKAPIEMNFHGVGNFRNKVVFAQMEENECKQRLHELAEEVRSRLSAVGVMETDSRGFAPHLTMMKLHKAPRNHLMKHKIRSYNESDYEELKDMKFGCQQVESLQICLMKARDPKTGYYQLLTDAQCC